MQDNVRRKCIFHPYLTIQCHRHVGHQNSSHDHASLDSYFEEEPVVVGDAPQQRVEPFVSVIYWTYHIKQVLNHKIRQQGKASNHSIFSSVCLPREMLKNLVHSQDTLIQRLVVCTAHLCHPPPHHHKKDGASFSPRSITIGKKGN